MVGLRIAAVVVTVAGGPTDGGPVGMLVVFRMMGILVAAVLVAGIGDVPERAVFFMSVGTIGEQFVIVFESVTGPFVAEAATADAAAAATTTLCAMVVAEGDVCNGLEAVDTGVDFSKVGVTVFTFVDPPLTSDITGAE